MAEKAKPKFRLKKIPLYLIPGIYALTCLFPVIWLFYTSFKTQNQFNVDSIGLPGKLYFGNWVYALTTMNLPKYMFNTIRITVIVLFLTLSCSFINGYFIQRFRFKGRRLLSSMYMCNLFIPVHAILVPTYIIFTRLGLANHWYSTILPVMCIELTTSTFLVQSYMESIPIELEEAAAIDGSSFSRTLFMIILPMARPVLTTIGIITFFHCWNEFVYSLVMFKSEQLFTISLALMRSKSEYIINYPQIFTVIFVCCIPALALYCAFSKYIIKGMVMGAVKG